MLTKARRGWAATLAIGLGLGVSLVSASPASAATLGPNFLRNWATGQCLDSGWPDEGGRGYVYTNPCDSSNDHQKWTVYIIGHASYDIVMIQNKATGKCLSRQMGFPASTFSCNGNDANQQWQGVGSGWDKVSLRDLGLGSCLDSNATDGVHLRGCNGGGNQLWKLGY